MYDKKVVDDEATYLKFGYHVSSLATGSRNPVIFNCVGCSSVITRPYKERFTGHKCDVILNGKKRCSACMEWLDKDLFPINNHKRCGYGAYCKKCFSKKECVKKHYKKKSQNIRDNFEVFLSHKLANIKTRSKKKGIECSISLQDMKILFSKQNGRCYYTGLDLVRGDYSPVWNSLSVERLDPNKGYTKDNVVFCCYCINSFKNDYTEEEFKENLPKLIIGLQEYLKR